MAGRVDADRAALSRNLPRSLRIGLLVVPAAFVAVFYAWPLVALLTRVLRSTEALEVLRRPGLGRITWFTLWQAVVSTVATIVVGFGPAYLLARFHFRGRRALYTLVTVPFMLPTVVVGAAFLAILPTAWHDSPTALLLAHVFFNVAVVVRLVGPMWGVIPRDLTGAAQMLGASPRKVLWHVVIPLLRPALLAAATVVFLFTFTSFGAATLLAGPANPTLEVEIARRATQLGDIDGAATLAVLQLLFLAGVIAWLTRWQRRAAVQLRGRAPVTSPRPGGQRRMVYLCAALLTAAFVAPLAAIVVQSLRTRDRWTLAAWRTLGTAEIRPGISLGVDPAASMLTSLRFAAVAAAVSVVIGTAAAFGIHAARRAGRLLDASVMLPLGTSAVTIGFGMLITFDQAPFDWRAQWWLIPLGHALVAVPFVVRALLPLLRAVPSGRLEAAALLGATPTRAWVEMVVRPTARAVAAAGALSAVISLGEFGATTLLTRSGRETMPIAIGRLLQRAGDIPRSQGFALATILMVVTAVVVALSDRPLRRTDA
jgi:thiamine transport system permease protein